MKKRKIWSVMLVSLVLTAGLIFSGCKNKEASDAEAQETAEAVTESDGETAETEPQEESAAESAVELDVNSLPADLEKMVHLMDSLNQLLCSYGAVYDAADPELVWGSIMITLGNSDWEEYGIQLNEDGMGITVPAALTEEVGYALFGELKGLPEIAENYSVVEEYSGKPAIYQEADGAYTFSIGDRGLSDYRVESFTDNGDGTYTAIVSLNATGPDWNEIVCFSYALRETTHASENAAFAYEIISAEPADKLTEDKLAGIPYFNMYTQEYGYEIYEEEDSKYYEIVEIPYFGTLNWDDTSFQGLNDRIMEELYSAAEEGRSDEVTWPDIRSYVMTDDTYMQAVSTAIIYPNYATQGDVYSYNYDKKNQCEMTIEDGLKLAGTTEEELLSKTAAAYMPDDKTSVYDRAELGGFRVKQDGSVDFYLKLFIKNPEADDFNQIATYQMSDETLQIYDGEVLIPDSEIDVFALPLTHGDKNKAADTE